MRKLHVNQDFVIREVSDNIVMLNSKTGEYFGLNPVGSDFLRLLQQNLDLDGIVQKMLTMYDVGEADLKADIDELVTKMLEKSILSDKTESDR